MITIVNEWYETKKNVNEMMHREKPTLKNGGLLSPAVIHRAGLC